MRSLKEVLHAVTKYSPQTLTEKKASVFDILHPGDIAIDCGANIGKVTAQMAKPGVTVYAFEPNPYAYAALYKRFSHMPNIHCINKAVWDRTSTLKLYFHKNNSSDPIKWSSGSSLLVEKENVSSDQYAEVEVIDLVEFIVGLGKPVRLLKIDIEGAECDVLNRLIDSGVAATIPSIVAETHEARIPRLQEDVKKLKEKITNHHLTNINLNWI